MTDKLTQAALDAAMKLMIDGLDMDPRGYPAHCEAIALAFDAFRPAITDAMVEAAADEIWEGLDDHPTMPRCRSIARACLTAVLGDKP